MLSGQLGEVGGKILAFQWTGCCRFKRTSWSTVIASTGFLAVIKLQLRDFLPEGRYHAADSAEPRQKLRHSELTNLVGEQAFGDLDFWMFKRRSATAHSSINVLKRNKPWPTGFGLSLQRTKLHLLSEQLLSTSNCERSNGQQKTKPWSWDTPGGRRWLMKKTEVKKRSRSPSNLNVTMAPATTVLSRTSWKPTAKRDSGFLQFRPSCNTTAPFSRENHLSYKYQRRCHSSLRTWDSSLEERQNPVQICR